MQIFKNKVGRPSNDSIQAKRKIYILVLIGIIAISSIVIMNFQTKFDNLNGKLILMPTVKTSKTVDKTGKYKINYKIKNNNNINDYYYKLFEYSNTDYASSNPLKVTNCIKINKYSKKDVVKTDKKNKNISYKLRIYNDINLCKKDINGVIISNKINSYPVIIKY